MRKGIVVLLLAVIVTMVFYLGLSGDFFFDDTINILYNVRLYVQHFNIDQFIYAALSFHDGHGERALPMLSFAIDYWRTGSMNPYAFKVTNLAIHILTSVMMLFFLRQLLIALKWQSNHAMWGGLILALCWAIHPMQVSSVLYVVQRMQTMEVLFILLALWAYLLMRQQQMLGGRGRIYGVLAVICWLLALVCKEDAILFPVYTLLLELTIFRFKATQAIVARGLKQSYSLFVVIFILGYGFVVIPHYGCLENCGRDFNSIERVLTQGRVLIMYIGQILLPLPDAFPFVYDNYLVSRNLWQPWTTLPALFAVMGLMVWAWRWRIQRPLFAFGILFFFAGHFVSSNVILLELIFEHRNYLPLLGIILAIADLILLVCHRYLADNKYILVIIPSIILPLFATSTAIQAYTWGEPIRLVQKLVRLEPQSRRAWLQYASAYFIQYNRTKDIQYVQQSAIITQEALKHFPNDATLAGNIILFKSMAGMIQDQDWQYYYRVLQTPIIENSRQQDKRLGLLYLKSNVEKGFVDDKEKLIQAFEIALKEGVWFEPAEYLEIGSFIYHGQDAKRALPFFEKAVQSYPKDVTEIQQLFTQLSEVGRQDWVVYLKKLYK